MRERALAELTAPLVTCRAARTVTNVASTLKAIVRELRGVEQRRLGVLVLKGLLESHFIALSLLADAVDEFPYASWF